MNISIISLRNLQKTFATIALFSLIAGMSPVQAFAGADKVNICKANQSAPGFVSGIKNVATNAVNTGIANSGVNGDIVENGQNWTTDYNGFTGQQIFQNNCVIPSKLTLIKNVIGGTAQPNDFNLKVGATSVLSGVSNTFAPNTYTVSETNLINYTPGNWSGDCSANGSVTLASGQNKTCTITNTYVPPVVACEAPYTGNVPNCIPPPCPQGYTGTYPTCVPPIVVCPTGTTGTYPDCTPIVTDCPVNTTGTFPNCVPIVCPTNYTGTYPACVPPPCPQGYTGTYPACVPPVVLCPVGTTGTYPDCIPIVTECPVNTTGTPPNCVPIVCPTNYTGTYPDCVPPPCPQGYTGTYPACVPPPVTCQDDNANNFGEVGACTYDEVPQCTNLLTNGSFEEPVVGGDWNIFSTVAGWTISRSDGLELWANGFYGGASDGNQNAELDGNAPTKITQNVATIPGATYKLQFDFSARPDADSVADNSVDALVNGSMLFNATADGSDVTTNTWSTHTQNFVAVGTSTEVAFEDKGTANSLGSLIDNARLCLVRAPEPAKVCDVTVVSDTTNTVTEKGGAFAQALTFIHNEWTATIPGAIWIWGDNPVVNPTTEETQHFVKTFNWNGPVTSALLDIASDNLYVVKLNGVEVANSGIDSNFSFASQDNGVDVTAGNIVAGTNTLDIAVKNEAQVDGTSKSNPAGLLYKLKVSGNTQVDCTSGGGGSSNRDVYRIRGNVWHDRDKDGTRIGDESSEEELSTWTVTITDGESSQTTTTDAIGDYYFDVTAGTWTITQESRSDWDPTFPSANKYVVTVPMPTEVTFLDSILSKIVSQALAADVVIATYSGYDFGDVQKTSSHSGGGRHHSSGRVLGDSTDKPVGQVLGAATSTVPVGAPNTGAGGTSPVAPILPTLTAIVGHGFSTRKVKNG